MTDASRRAYLFLRGWTSEPHKKGERWRAPHTTVPPHPPGHGPNKDLVRLDQAWHRQESWERLWGAKGES